jgi:hypothetical protein
MSAAVKTCAICHKAPHEVSHYRNVSVLSSFYNADSEHSIRSCKDILWSDCTASQHTCIIVTFYNLVLITPLNLKLNLFLILVLGTWI